MRKTAYVVVLALLFALAHHLIGSHSRANSAPGVAAICGIRIPEFSSRFAAAGVSSPYLYDWLHWIADKAIGIDSIKPDPNDVIYLDESAWRTARGIQ